MADGTRFRNGMTAVEFEASVPTFIKDALDFHTLFPSWTNTAAVDDGLYGGGYLTTSSQDQEPQFMATSVFAQPASSVYAQPPSPPTTKPTYRYYAGQLDASPTVAELPSDEYDVEENLSEFQIPMEGLNTQRTPSTVVQEGDQRSESEVVDDDDEPLKPRPSRKNSKKDSTPAGQVKGGNNPFGSKGTRTCGSCRKRKGKVPHLN
jgi:hypothetical protein